MTIEEIYYSEDISVRSFNVCNDNDLKDLNAILKHYREHKTFGNLRNCGKKSNEELTDLCMKYIDYGGSQIVEPSKPEKQLITAISSFNRTQREIVNSFIEINSNNLSNRSKNAITSFLNGNLKIRNISERILTNDRFNFQAKKNVGTKTVTELKSFIHTITEFIEKVAEVDSENDLVALRNRFFIEKTFSISYVPNEILESQSIFSLVDFLISKNAIFEKNESVIFQKAFKIFDNQQELTLDEIAEEINISRERVRQIRKGILDNLFNKLQFVKNIEEDLGEGEEQNRMKNQSGDCLVCKHDVIDAEKFVQDC
jgi:DNA-directed RNA polymerase specialized sigma subunit